MSYLFGYEIEFQGISEEKLGHVVEWDKSYWEYCIDGSGLELKTRLPFSDVSDHLDRCKILFESLKRHGASIDIKNWGNRRTPCGTHIHISSSEKVITNDISKHAKALNALRASTYACRFRYASLNVSQDKYSAIRLYKLERAELRLEIRAYNATFNLRGIRKMFDNTIQIADILYS